MADIVDTKTRSQMMSGIRGKNTKPELIVRRALHKRGLRFRLHHTGLPGSPDIVFPRYRAAIFVHGCFWHRHEECRYTTTPKTRTEFWEKKFEQNTQRDKRNLLALEKIGWAYRVVWECEIKNSDPGILAEGLHEWLQKSRS